MMGGLLSSTALAFRAKVGILPAAGICAALVIFGKLIEWFALDGLIRCISPFFRK